jgi:hypothetical protein
MVVGSCFFGTVIKGGGGSLLKLHLDLDSAEQKPRDLLFLELSY